MKDVKKKYLTRRGGAGKIGQVGGLLPACFVLAVTKRPGRPGLETMEKIVEQGLLYDFYGPLLTGHQQKIYQRLVYDDLSLNEIAEAEGISRQAVHDLIRRCTAQMQKYEELLGMIRRFETIRDDAEKLEALAEKDLDLEALRKGIRQQAEKIKKDLE